MDNGKPIIRLEIQGMKQSIVMALTQHTARMDTEIKAAVERACSPQGVLDIIERTAKEAVDGVIKEEIRNFYQRGGGRVAIREAVHEMLNAHEERGRAQIPRGPNEHKKTLGFCLSDEGGP